MQLLANRPLKIIVRKGAKLLSGDYIQCYEMSQKIKSDFHGWR